MSNDKSQAADFFHVSNKQAKPFEIVDPFNPSNTLKGFICRKDGPFGGSLFITHVNQVKLNEPQKIYGVPKLLYPYVDKKNSDDLEEFEGAEEIVPKKKKVPGSCKYKSSFQTDDNIVAFALTNKWNGTNILFFKYYDNSGQMFVSAKTKGSATLSDTQFGDFFALTKEALFGKNHSERTLDISHPPEVLHEFFKRPEIQSISCELCGIKEPHLVKYDFDIALKPLFMQFKSGGNIEPIIDPNDTHQQLFEFVNFADMCHICKERQKHDFALNDEYRKKNNLEIRYEYNHFATEGAVLYILTKPNRLLGQYNFGNDWIGVSNRKLYKIKPKDIEEVHWGTFGEKQKSLVEIAVKKLRLREKEFSKDSLREELDIGPKEFKRYQNDILQYARQYFNSMPKTSKSSKTNKKKK
ncbi:hypothetical protein C9374_007826 [Naegleria lovaniensis]|uniref:Uncharacterized protein n=1 Tax=Naegleria lovaniensis TaxID=51637 RepID=A0AA88GHJ3_NAELO|nr:uncharacterized protein C9374_007826 [Naegleria lovaniensis]KAG2378678.1 hypothetical protein C9374_007826 [Naegleria lovaniensis]